LSSVSFCDDGAEDVGVEEEDEDVPVLAVLVPDAATRPPAAAPRRQVPRLRFGFARLLRPQFRRRRRSATARPSGASTWKVVTGLIFTEFSWVRHVAGARSGLPLSLGRLRPDAGQPHRVAAAQPESRRPAVRRRAEPRHAAGLVRSGRMLVGRRRLLPLLADPSRRHHRRPFLQSLRRVMLSEPL